MRRVIVPIVLILAACDRAPEAPTQEIALNAPARVSTDAMTTSPDTEGAAWTVDATGQAIDFGKAGMTPLMTLSCRLDGEEPQLAVIRHAAARPGLKAIFPVIGNGMRSRFMVDAVLADNEWRWEGVLPADDPQLEVFTGPRALTATLPGRGMLKIAGSRIPGEFITWCRKGGEVIDAEADEAEADEAEVKN